MRPPEAADLELAQAFRQGRKEAFHGLVDRHLDRLVAYLRYLRVPEAHLDDLVQETFLRAFLSFGAFDLARPFLPWLLRIGRNVFFTAARKEEHEAAKAGALDRPPPVDVERTAESNLAVEDWMRRLDEEERLLVELRVFQRVPFAEIAGLFQMQEPAVRIRFSRLMKRLRGVAGEEEAGHER